MIIVLQQLETELKLRGFSDKTLKSYLFHNQKFLDFIKKNPEDIEEQDIKSYLAHLISDKQLKPSSVNLVLCTLKFFYQKVLEKDIFNRVSSVKSEKKIPIVLSKAEIKQLLASSKNRKHKLLIELMYSSGLRVSEAVSMRIVDLDIKEKIGKVVAGKGKKDRLVILSNSFIRHLDTYLRQRLRKGVDSPFLFYSNKDKQASLSIRQAQKTMNVLSKKAGIQKKVFCHALRSSFATHLLDQGVSIRVIQELLGHTSISTTERYVKVSTEQLKKVQSPMDSL